MLEQIIARIREPDQGAAASAKSRQDLLTKPAGSLGRLEETLCSTGRDLSQSAAINPG